MTHTIRLSSIAIAVLGCFFSGCNSHATFEKNNANNANNGNCGNHRIDPGETCEHSEDGNPFFNFNATCETLGFTGGMLKCDAECRNDTSNCTGTTCDPITGGGCIEQGHGCYLNSGMGGGYCAPAGYITNGSCISDTYCAPGHICSNPYSFGEKICLRLCIEDIPCASGVCGYSGEQPGICLEPTWCTDVLAGSDCGGQEQFCAIVNMDGDTTCLLSNGIPEGEYCDMFNRCAAGHYCASDGDHKCHRLCMTSDECSFSQLCNSIWTLPGVAGFCG